MEAADGIEIIEINCPKRTMVLAYAIMSFLAGIS